MIRSGTAFQRIVASRLLSVDALIVVVMPVPDTVDGVRSATHPMRKLATERLAAETA
jgi:hypothetical protein